MAREPAGRRGLGRLADSEAPSRPPQQMLLRARYHTLPDGFHLLVARKTDNVENFREMIAIGLAWAAGLFLLLAAAAGISTSRRSVARIEAINAMSRTIIEIGLRERIPTRGTWDE
jgi:hypothetical protein